MTLSPDNSNQPPLWAEPDSNICARLADGTIVKNLIPMSLFPLSEDNKNIVILDDKQQEIFYIDDLQQLEPTLANDIQVALLRNRFILKLLKIHKASSLRPPAEWKVLTDQGRILPRFFFGRSYSQTSRGWRFNPRFSGNQVPCTKDRQLRFHFS